MPGPYDPYAIPGATPPFAPRPQMGPPAPPVGPPAPGMTDPYAKAGIGSIPPEVLVELLGTQGDIRDLSALEKQLEQANALRNTAGPEGRSSGRVYVAANPLEHLGHGIGQYRMMKKARKLEGDTQAKRDTIKKNEQRIGTEWAKKRGGY